MTTQPSLPDVLWRAEMSGALKDLIAEVKELTLIVMELHQRLTAQEAKTDR